MKAIKLPSVPSRAALFEAKVTHVESLESNVWKIEADEDSIEAYMTSTPPDGKTFSELTEGLWDPEETGFRARITRIFARAS